MTDLTDNGLINLRSGCSVTDTLAALRSVLSTRGVAVAAYIDHARAARDAGLDLRPTQLLIFGNPA